MKSVIKDVADIIGACGGNRLIVTYQIETDYGWDRWVKGSKSVLIVSSFNPGFDYSVFNAWLLD